MSVYQIQPAGLKPSDLKPSALHPGSTTTPLRPAASALNQQPDTKRDFDPLTVKF